MAGQMNSKVRSVKHSDVLEYLNYDPETGVFTWKKSPSARAKIGAQAGKISPSTGYRYVTLHRISMSAARLAWFYVHGEWPDLLIDHINGVRTDNRISNLRLCTHKQNMQNVFKIREASEINSEFMGVHWDKQNEKWVSSISYEGIRVRVGSFVNERKAFMAYLMAKRVFHDMQKTVREFDKIGFDEKAVSDFIDTGEIPSSN